MVCAAPYNKIEISQPIHLSIPTDKPHQVRTKVQIPEIVQAPITKGQAVGKINILVDDEVVAETPLVAQEDIILQSWLRQPLEWLTLQWEKSTHSLRQ